jgi:hypothetical protein
MRATVWPSVLLITDFALALTRAPFRATQTEDKKLRKDLTLEVPCFEGTLRIALGKTRCFPNRVPWPGRLSAGCNAALTNLDAGRARELQKYAGQPHTALGSLLIADKTEGAQGDVYKVGAGQGTGSSPTLWVDSE